MLREHQWLSASEARRAANRAVFEGLVGCALASGDPLWLSAPEPHWRMPYRSFDGVDRNIPSLQPSPGHVLNGKTAWGLTSDQWGIFTGTMSNNGAVTVVPTTANQSIAAGYHNGSGAVQGDTDLVAGNVRQGVNLFGVVGTLTGGNTYNAGVPEN